MELSRVRPTNVAAVPAGPGKAKGGPKAAPLNPFVRRYSTVFTTLEVGRWLTVGSF